MPSITPEDTYTNIIGSGALRFVWYRETADNLSLLFTDIIPADWEVSFAEYGTSTRYKINHKVLMDALKRIAEPGSRIGELSDACRREAREFLYGDKEKADFDADLADEVIQVAVWGSVIYG